MTAPAYALAPEPKPESKRVLARTPLHARHVQLNARMVAFAGYDMPVQYPTGVMREHHHTRKAAGLFDVSHMGQFELVPHQTGAVAAEIFESIVPGGIASLAEGQMRYTQLTNGQGGIVDDLIVTRFGNKLWLVVNAACKDNDATHIKAALGDRLVVTPRARALLALQGPKAAEILAQIFPTSHQQAFMQARWYKWRNAHVLVARCGYTGEDGFEISLPKAHADAFMAQLLAHTQVAPIGLGARDSLRLEAGLCLYGHDIDTTTTPIEAGLAWSIPKRRLVEGDFPGAARIRQQVERGVSRLRVGLRLEGRAIARAGARIHTLDGDEIGQITSGGFAPSCAHGIAIGYVPAEYAVPETPLHLMVRGKPMRARITALPFVPHRYHRCRT